MAFPDELETNKQYRDVADPWHKYRHGESIQAKLLISASSPQKRKEFIASRYMKSVSPSELLYPIYEDGGILFPYTPSLLTLSQMANYSSFQPTHSNFSYNRYVNSSVGDIMMSFNLTATTQQEFRHSLAVMHFLKIITKMNFGEESAGNKSYHGAPPPVLQFSYGGAAWAKNVPVVLASIDTSITDEHQLISVADIGGEIIEGLSEEARQSMFPMKQLVTITMKPHYRPEFTRKFSVKKFGSGELLRKGYM